MAISIGTRAEIVQQFPEDESKASKLQIEIIINTFGIFSSSGNVGNCCFARIMRIFKRLNLNLRAIFPSDMIPM